MNLTGLGSWKQIHEKSNLTFRERERERKREGERERERERERETVDVRDLFSV